MRKNFAWLITSLACAAYFVPPPPTIFSVEILNCFSHERITLDCNYHFRIQGKDCCGSYSGEGDLSPEEAQQFLADFRKRYSGLPSRPIGQMEPFEVFQGENIFWKGEWTQAERAWFNHTWCAREQQSLPRPEFPLSPQGVPTRNHRTLHRLPSTPFAPDARRRTETQRVSTLFTSSQQPERPTETWRNHNR